MKHITKLIMAAVGLVIGFQATQGEVMVRFDQRKIPIGSPSPADARQTLDSAAFFQSAFADNKTEIVKGNLAAMRASSQAVKDLALLLVNDHMALTHKVNALAESKTTILSKQLDPKDQAKIDQLSSLSGTAFDKGFLADQVTEHQKVIAYFERTAAISTDPDVKSFAENTLPILRKDLQMLRDRGVDSGLVAVVQDASTAPPVEDQK